MVDFTVLLPQGAFATAVAATLDLLTSAALLAPRLHLPAPTWRIRSLASVAGPVELSNGLSVHAQPLTRSKAVDDSIWILPGLATPTAADLDARLRSVDLQRLIPLLQAHLHQGGAVAASCSAVFLLQAAGLLRGRKVTTTWWLAAHLASLEPACKVDANRMVINDGPVWTAGAALAHTDLLLQLLRAHSGVELADAVARVLLIDGREAQAPFIVPALLGDGHPLVAQLAARIEAALPQTPSMAGLASELCMSQRTLARRIQAATGQSPSHLIQTVRLKRARLLLQTSRLSVEQIAADVGYRDATALRRLMRKAFAATPRQFRELQG